MGGEFRLPAEITMTKETIPGGWAYTMKNGRPATQGTCSTCGTKITVIGGGTTPRRRLVRGRVQIPTGRGSP